MEKILFIFLFFFLISFVAASQDCDCSYNGNCYFFGDTLLHPQLGGLYCDYKTGTMIPQKDSGECENDFECSNKCLAGSCTSLFSEMLSVYNTLILGENFCIEEGMFCFNETQPLNSTKLTDYKCDFGFFCYKCNSPYYWNSTLKQCIRGMCDKTPGCLNLPSLNNSEVNDLYCAVGKCFSCKDDYEWNSTNQTCRLRRCDSIPGCLNITNLTNAIIRNRFCEVGNCFVCKPGYIWNNSTSSCVFSSTSSLIGSRNWNNILVSSSDLENGIEKILQPYDRVQFLIGGSYYYLSILDVVSNYKVNYNIEPTMEGLSLTIGTENKHDPNLDGKEDISINLLSIENGRARIKISSLKPNVTQSITSQVSSQTNLQSAQGVPEEEQKGLSDKIIFFIILIGFVFLILIVIIIYLVVSKDKTKSSLEDFQSYTQPSPTTIKNYCFI